MNKMNTTNQLNNIQDLFEIPISNELKETYNLLPEFNYVGELVHTKLMWDNKCKRFPCLCGSGEPFGLCCHGIMDNTRKINDRICNEHITFETDMVNGEDVKYRISWYDLPSPWVEQINEYLIDNPIHTGSCWFTSHRVASLIKGVQVVNGWYSFSLSAEKLASVEECWDRSWKKRLYDDVYQVNLADGKPKDIEIIDIKNKLTYHQHSWNVIKGAGDNGGDIHFDLVGQLLSAWKTIECLNTWDCELNDENFSDVSADAINYFNTIDYRHSSWENYRMFEILDINDFNDDGWDLECSAFVSMSCSVELNHPNFNPFWKETCEDTFLMERNAGGWKDGASYEEMWNECSEKYYYKPLSSNQQN